MVAIKDPEVMELLAEISADLSEELGDRELAMHKCVETVTGRSREILRLRYVDDLKPAEIAKRLRLDAGHVRVILNRIRSALRDCVERRTTGEGATA
jgi:RNA polymerase sigma-70 factor (ECF subfamily)